MYTWLTVGVVCGVFNAGTKVATKVICVAGSMIVVAEKKSKLKPAAKIKSSEPTWSALNIMNDASPVMFVCSRVSKQL